MIQRDSRYYTSGYDGNDSEQSPFFLNCSIFDGKDGELNDELITEFNNEIKRVKQFAETKLIKHPIECIPARVVVINASHDKLPTSYETARVFESIARKNGWDISFMVVNTRDELMNETEKFGSACLVMSQCVDKAVYNADLAMKLREKGVVAVPGEVTAPGGIFSDKGSTYKLLSEDHTMWDLVARYSRIDIEGKSIELVSQEIIDQVDALSDWTGIHQFYIKPTEGGGGLGGFRITRFNGGYLIPDLSKVTGLSDRIHPTYIDFDVTSSPKIQELIWIYTLFNSDENLRKAYLKVRLRDMETASSDTDRIEAMARYLSQSEMLRHKKLKKMVWTRNQAILELKTAISQFEKKLKRRYIPLVNEHIDFGTWGLRAHFRLAPEGPVLETMYSRIFQIAFTEEGVGYVGADNISNKQTGELEILRLRPVNLYMLGATGGHKALFHTLLNGARALFELDAMVPNQERNRIPLRLQLDLATISQKIGEGNADTARGLCLASRWDRFVRNTAEWFENSLGYYSWRKTRPYLT